MTRRSMIRNADGTITVTRQPDMIGRLSEWQREGKARVSSLDASVAQVATAIQGGFSSTIGADLPAPIPGDAADDLANPRCRRLLDVCVCRGTGIGEDDTPNDRVGCLRLDIAEVPPKNLGRSIVAGGGHQDLHDIRQRHVGRDLVKLPFVLAFDFSRHLVSSVRWLRGGDGDGPVATTHPHNHSRDGDAA